MSIESEQDWAGLREAGRIVRLVLDAMERAVRPGVTTAELDAVAARVLAENGARHAPRHGFVVIRDLAGHGIGRTIHEPPSVPNYYDWRARDVLTEGMVITIEPIIAQRSRRCVEDPDGWTIRTADGGLSAHYEQTLVVTRGRPVLLTAA